MRLPGHERYQSWHKIVKPEAIDFFALHQCLEYHYSTNPSTIRCDKQYGSRALKKNIMSDSNVGSSSDANGKSAAQEEVGEIYRDDKSSSPSATAPTVLQRHKDLAARHPQYIILATVIFCVLLASGVAIATVSANVQIDQMEADALSVAEETGQFFSQNLDRAILPLFSLAQFVREIQEFRDLPSQIGLPLEDGSLPFLDPPTSGDHATHRNVTGVCDNPLLTEKFDRIAGAIKKDAGMDGVLVNLQLVPDAVVCLVHPVNNTDDFPPGVYLDNTGAIGHDLLYDPKRKFIAEATVPSEKVVIAGPLKLLQCPENCNPLVEKAFIARLPIPSETNVILVDGNPHMRWGFAVALINWNALVEKSGVYESFADGDLEFQLTRTDYIPNGESGTVEEKIVVLAESRGFDIGSERQVYTELATTNNDWAITVSYCAGGCVEWYWLVVIAWIFISFAISLLVYMTFSQKQLYTDEMAVKSALMVETAQQAARSERELNDFIAHEVRNPIAAALSACSFVSASVNEKEPLVTAESRKTVREDVHIIEASLQFVNDLLRSMLDLHRAKTKQLKIQPVPTDMKRDILEPVATMLYRRDEAFDVIIDCPDDLLFSTDRLRLKQIVLNLARNSAKFVESGYVRLRANAIESCIIIHVEDSGPGIPEEKKEQLFAKFQQSLDSLSQGTGIGLSLSQRLIDLMGGSIELDETFHSDIKGKPGAKFDIRLPGCEVESAGEMKVAGEEVTLSTTPEDDSNKELQIPVENGVLGADPTTYDLQKPSHSELGVPLVQRVMFVDDDMVLRKLFTRSIKRSRPDWIIAEASNGETAIRLAQQEDFDIIFMDQYMTSIEKQLLGTEATRVMRSKGVNSIICGLSANDMEAAFQNAGADAFMIKPFPCKSEQLLEELFRICNSRRR